MAIDDHTAGPTERALSIEDALAEVPRLAAAQGPIGTWHPFATRVEGRSAGAHAGGGWKITHHTTEGTSAAGAIAAYRRHGGWPHFTAEWVGRRMRVIQHLPLEVAARTLVNPADQWETNRARTIQIEHVGFARNTGRWSDARYAAIGRLCRWIEENTGCPRAVTRGVDFARPRKLTGQAFHQRSGHNGHVHVPGNDHTDPGRGFRIRSVLRRLNRPHRTLRSGDQGPDVAAFQRAVNARARACRRPEHLLDVDGIVGPLTLRHGAWAAWILGVARTQADLRRRGISARVQRFVRDPRTRSAAQRELGTRRHRRHCRRPPSRPRARATASGASPAPS